MQTTITTTLRRYALAVLVALTACTFTSCSNDDDDEPDVTPAAQTFEGSLTTTIPAMPSFKPVTSDITATITWLNPQQTEAKIDIDAFTIQTGMPGRDYAIGAMTITDVKCTKDAKGNITLTQESFSCQAGEYATTGSLTGEYADGNLICTLMYKPGSMPFEVQSVFNGTDKGVK